MKFSIETTFRETPIKLNFIRQSGNLAISGFNIRSEDGDHKFSIRNEGDKFIIYNIESSDTTNLYFIDMAETIENIRQEILSHTS